MTTTPTQKRPSRLQRLRAEHAAITRLADAAQRRRELRFVARMREQLELDLDAPGDVQQGPVAGR